MIRAFKDEYWIVGVTVTTIFETAWALRGYEQILIDFATNPTLVDRLFEIPFRYHLAAALKLVELGVDMIWIGDDVGAQHNMLISRRPGDASSSRSCRIHRHVEKRQPHRSKSLTIPMAIIYPIIPDLIEIGLDVLNPIQPASMDPARLKREFGDRLCFWGSIDEQYTLPFGTPAAVRNEVRERLRTLGKNGGLIIGPTHHVQLDTPLENFWAMARTVTKPRTECSRRVLPA